MPHDSTGVSTPAPTQGSQDSRHRERNRSVASPHGRHVMKTTATVSTVTAGSTGAPDLGALKARQHAAWSSGDYAVIGTTLQIVGEELCEALDLRSGRKVLDVAAGNGMVSLAAARR